jgi:hypothetical protein
MKTKQHAGYFNPLMGTTASICGRKGVTVTEWDEDEEITCKQCQRIIHDLNADYIKSRKQYLKKHQTVR